MHGFINPLQGVHLIIQNEETLVSETSQKGRDIPHPASSMALLDLDEEARQRPEKGSLCPLQHAEFVALSVDLDKTDILRVVIVQTHRRYSH